MLKGAPSAVTGYSDHEISCCYRITLNIFTNSQFCWWLAVENWRNSEKNVFLCEFPSKLGNADKHFSELFEMLVAELNNIMIPK